MTRPTAPPRKSSPTFQFVRARAVDLGTYRKVFLGEQFAVGLSERGGFDDPHVVFTILSEDDGTWFAGGDSAASSYWLPDLLGVINEAHTWCSTHCTRDGQHGWRFR